MPVALMLSVVLAMAAPDREAEYQGALRVIAPGAVEDFQKGTEALTSRDWAGAVQRFEAVHAAAPQFTPALRRLGYVRAMSGEFDVGLALAEQARTLEDSFASSFSIALVLSLRKGPGDLTRAIRVLHDGLRKEPEDLQGNLLDCELQAMVKDPNVSLCFERVARQFPDNEVAQYFGAVAAGERGNLAESREKLERAHTLGLDDAAYRDFLGKLDDAQPFYERYWKHALWALGAWGASWLMLMAAGLVLSALTLAEARKVPTERTGAHAGGSAVLHKAYAAVIFASAVFFYVSLPLLLVVVVGLGVGLVYACLTLGRIPIKLIVVVGAMVLVTVYAVIKSLFARPSDADPGHKLDPAEEPGLRAVLTEVAAKIQTRPVDNVYLTPGADLAVMERGSLRKRLGGNTERCLILGVGVLDGMTQGQFKSVLAHEYGHFSNRDTAGGNLGLGVRLSLVTMAQALAEGGAAAWYNPAWLFFLGFYRVFLRISQGATRLQEVLADRWAAFSYGSDSFSEGLTHAIRQTIRFDAHANATLKEVIEGKKALMNLYAFVPSDAVPSGKVDEALKDVMEREPSPYDSHPRPVDRIAWVKALNVARPEDASAASPAWALFADREALERKMTDEIRGNLATQGLAVPAA